MIHSTLKSPSNKILTIALVEINLIKLVKLLHIELKIMKNYYKSRRYTFRSIPKKTIMEQIFKIVENCSNFNFFCQFNEKKNTKK